MFTQRYQVLSQNELEMIHDNSLRIMEEIGIVITYEPAREIYAKHGAKVDGNRVYFPRKLVEEAIKLSPSSFTLYARNPKYNVEINTEKVVNAGPYGSPFVTDMDRGRRDATLEDFINIVNQNKGLDTSLNPETLEPNKLYIQVSEEEKRVKIIVKSIAFLLIV